MATPIPTCGEIEYRPGLSLKCYLYRIEGKVLFYVFILCVIIKFLVNAGDTWGNDQEDDGITGEIREILTKEVLLKALHDVYDPEWDSAITCHCLAMDLTQRLIGPNALMDLNQSPSPFVDHMRLIVHKIESGSFDEAHRSLTLRRPCYRPRNYHVSIHKSFWLRNKS